MAQRYELRHDEDGSWSVIDRFTGLPVAQERLLLAELQKDEADYLVALLNSRDRVRRVKP